ncbi:MAG: hypothetical protein K9N10_22800 [Deltaproteobacteria bacterium]|nr:hypothetical protein [Deltaproteobacteria bacterium]
MKFRSFVIALIILLIVSQGYADWEFYEKTNVKGTITGTIKKGHIFEMQSGSIYKVSGITIQVVVEVFPEALVLRDGKLFKVVIDGFDEPLLCEQLAQPASTKKRASGKSPGTDVKVIKSNIDGTFNGWSGETIFKLTNGQIWQQTAYAYMYHYAYRPEVMIINVDGIWKMKVKGVDEMIAVKRLR